MGLVAQCGGIACNIFADVEDAEKHFHIGDVGVGVVGRGCGCHLVCTACVCASDSIGGGCQSTIDLIQKHRISGSQTHRMSPRVSRVGIASPSHTCMACGDRAGGGTRRSESTKSKGRVPDPPDMLPVSYLLPRRDMAVLAACRSRALSLRFFTINIYTCLA